MAELTKGIAQLIERIKEDGIASGENERERILEEARATAEAHLAEARAEAERILSEAKTEAETTKQRANAALKLAAHDFLAAFRHSLRQQHVRPLITDNVGALLADEAFLGNAVTQLFRDYVAAGGKQITLVVKPELKTRLTAWFAQHLEDDLSQRGVAVEAEEGLEGFRLQRDEEGFFWDFTLEAVGEALADLVDPGLKPYMALGLSNGGAP